MLLYIRFPYMIIFVRSPHTHGILVLFTLTFLKENFFTKQSGQDNQSQCPMNIFKMIQTKRKQAVTEAGILANQMISFFDNKLHCIFILKNGLQDWYIEEKDILKLLFMGTYSTTNQILDESYVFQLAKYVSLLGLRIPVNNSIYS